MLEFFKNLFAPKCEHCGYKHRDNKAISYNIWGFYTYKCAKCNKEWTD